MLTRLISAGDRLAGQRDPRLTRGLRLAWLEGLCAAALYPLLYGLLSSLLHGRAQLSTVVGIGLALLGCLVARMLLGALGMPLIFIGAYAMMAAARLRIVDHLQRLPLGWFSRHHSGETSARVTSDLELVENLWSHFLGLFSVSLSTLLGLLAFLFWLQPLLALSTLLMLPLAWLAILVAQRKVMEQAGHMLDSNNRAQAALQEYLQGLAVIRSSGRFGSALQRLEQVLDDQHRAMVSIELKPAPWLALFGLVIEAGYVLTVLLGCWLLSEAMLSIEQLLLYAVLAWPLYRQAIDLGLSTLLLRFGHLALSRTEQLLQQQALPEPTTPTSPVHFTVQLRDVRFSYPGQSAPALDGVSCDLPAGSLTAVVGPSGAGKSTLAHLIARLWDVDAGQISIGGVALTQLGSDAVQQSVSMVFQDVTLFSGSVLDNLRIGCPLASEQQVIDAAKLAQAHEFIQRLPDGYATPIGEGGGWLSGGERQRLSIARALLKNSPILLLDEATSSVDPSSEAAIQQALDALVINRTVLVIAHRLHSVRHAGQILVMDNGRLVEQGRHDDLLNAGGLYARLWQQQEEAREWRLHP